MTKRKPAKRPWWKFWKPSEQPVPKIIPYDPKATEHGTTRTR